MGFDAPEWGASSRFRSSSRPIPQFEQKRMATESFRRCGECFLGPVGLAHSRATGAQGPMAGLPFTSLPLSAETTFQSQEFRVLFLHPLATFASVFVHLPMRPSTQLSWPSSRSVSVSRGIGAPGIRVGKCSCPRLPGGRRKGHNECAGAGHGSPSSPTGGQPQAGSRCR